ncbi:replication-relaxation family protein [Bacillus cereus group sp. BfR-BA-01347]|uniref:replication-relaxation family protein n=1 Tax=Bacillus cereus group sp. BfR-BA-01347 TaxID=2920310 RepID=UPI001F580016|nr:replication-relaxation family protein [Bacillus cereus group sp. BfR-BA-01347]
MGHVIFSEEDFKLFVDIHRHIYVDFEYIWKMCYSGFAKVTVYQRLKRLEDNGYIKRSMIVPATVKNVETKSRRPFGVYTLDKYGVEMAEELIGEVHWNSKWSKRVPTFVYHSLMLGHIECSMALASKTDERYDYKEWINEARATYRYTKSPKDILRPDGIAIVGPKTNDMVRAGLMLEMERSYASKDVVLKKVLRYNDFFQRGEEMLKAYDVHVGFDYPVNFWKLIFIARDESRKKELLRHLKDAAQPPLYEVEQNGQMVKKQRYDIYITTYHEMKEAPFGKIYADLNDPTVKIGI